MGSNGVKDLEWVEIDPDLSEIIPEYLQTKKNEVAELPAALEKRNFEWLQRFGHSLKGSGGGYGFDKLTDIGATIEIQSKSQEVEKLAKSIEDLRDYLGRVRIKNLP